MRHIHVRPIEPADVSVLAEAFGGPDWGGSKPASLFERYVREHESGERDVLVAFRGDAVAGYATIRWEPAYEPFRDAGVPTVEDLNVLISHRRKRVASALMDEAERRIGERSDTAGIGFGMDPGYGNAQRMYPQRGYVPDGRGLTTHDHPVKSGDTVRVDDDLVLYLTKRLR
ncbi:MAG: GNAT family N-acetyltransferase [Dehalococcoidia bacterium]